MRAVRLDQADLARHGDAARPVEEREAAARLAKRVGGEVGQHGDVVAGVDQAAPSGRRCRHRRAAPSRASAGGSRGCSLRGPGCSAISSASASSQVRPRSCSMFQSLVQTLSKNQLRSAAIGDEAAEGQVGIVVDQHLADVEDDVADFASCRPQLSVAFVAPGMAASMTFFMTVGKASPANVVRRPTRNGRPAAASCRLRRDRPRVRARNG